MVVRSDGADADAGPRSWAIERRHRRSSLEAVLHVSSAGVELHARTRTDAPPGSYWHRDAQLALTVRVRPSASCRLGDVDATWDLEPSLSESSPFRAFVDHVRATPLDADAAAAGTDAPPSDANDADLQHLCALAARHAVARCERGARHLALAFAIDARMFVYGALVDDWWRRIEQAVGVCPGAFVVAATLPASRDALVRDLRQGAKLGPILTTLATASGATNRHATTLIRRAPRELAPDALRAIVREPAIDANDAPMTESDVATWYAWCAAAACGARPLAGFVSKHALELAHRANTRGLDARWQLAEIRDWLAHSGAVPPSRASAPARVLAAIDAWYRSRWEPRHDPATRLSPPPVPTTCVDGIRAHPLTTIGELIEEGRRMHHCVGVRADVALAKPHAFFRALVHGEPTTIEVARGPHGWYLVEASGIANRRPAHPHTIQRWVECLRDAAPVPSNREL